MDAMEKGAARGAFAALAALCFGFGCAGGAPRVEAPDPGTPGAVTPEMGSPRIGELAPDFELLDREGRRVRLSELRGEIVVLHFGASFCPYCLAELPHLDALAEELGARARVLIVDVAEDAAKLTEYATRLPTAIPFLHDADGAVARRYAPPNVLPSFRDRAQVVIAANVIVDREGRIRFFTLLDSAGFDAELVGLRRALEALMREQPAAEVEPEVVEVRVRAPRVRPGERGELRVDLEVAPGFHIMSDRPSRPELIPTEVAVRVDAPGIAVGAPVFPPSGSFAIGREHIATFAGTVAIRVPFAVRRDAAPGRYRAEVRASYQACTASRCLFPRGGAALASVHVGW